MKLPHLLIFLAFALVGCQTAQKKPAIPPVSTGLDSADQASASLSARIDRVGTLAEQIEAKATELLQ